MSSADDVTSDGDPRHGSPDDSETPDGTTTTPKRVLVDYVYPTKVMTRFFGVKTLNPDNFAKEFKNITEEVLAHLRAGGTSLTLRLEIEAINDKGFDEGKIRTVSENAASLKFNQAGFEES